MLLYQTAVYWIIRLTFSYSVLENINLWHCTLFLIVQLKLIHEMMHTDRINTSELNQKSRANQIHNYVILLVMCGAEHSSLPVQLTKEGIPHRCTRMTCVTLLSCKRPRVHGQSPLKNLSFLTQEVKCQPHGYIIFICSLIKKIPRKKHFL